MLFPTRKAGEACRLFIADRSSKVGPTVHARLIQLHVSPEKDASNGIVVDAQTIDPTVPFSDLFIILVPSESFSFAKEFWQHTGMGISSRLADHLLSILLPTESPNLPPQPPPSKIIGKVANKHYSAKRLSISPPSSPVSHIPVDDFTLDHNTYLEERYGRNLPHNAASSAKRALRRRIAGVLVKCPHAKRDCISDENAVLGPSSRGVSSVSESDVFLYPGGMNAIWNAHQMLLHTRPEAKSVCFGFVRSFFQYTLRIDTVPAFLIRTL